MPSRWGRIRAAAALVSAGLIVGFTVAHVTGGGRTILFACLVGLLPVAFFLAGSQLARGLSSTIALVIVAAYAASWIYGVRQYNGDKVDGLGLFFFLVPALGCAALTPVVAGHWLVYLWRDWRTHPEVGRGS